MAVLIDQDKIVIFPVSAKGIYVEDFFHVGGILRIFGKSSPLPALFVVRDLIMGWQIVLTRMHEGDRWEVYIPATWEQSVECLGIADGRHRERTGLHGEDGCGAGSYGRTGLYRGTRIFMTTQEIR